MSTRDEASNHTETHLELWLRYDGVYQFASADGEVPILVRQSSGLAFL